MLELITNRGDIAAELHELVRCFASFADREISVNFTYVGTARTAICYVGVAENRYTYTYPQSASQVRTEFVRHDLYVCKHALYRALSAFFGKRLPWGSLTGIRPTRLAVRLAGEGISLSDVERRLQADYDVSPAKAALTVEILQVQTKHIGDRLSLVRNEAAVRCDDAVNLYVHVPFCPTRCAYCSFVSEGIEKKSWLLAPYAAALTEEIRRTKEMIYEQGKRIFSVYIGGGTPTVLPPDKLREVLAAAFAENTEYTCEAGRPDTIDDEKLQVLSSCGVNRISINPQTLHDKTLRLIGRAHTTEQFYAAYEAAERYGFVKNVDLIAGLTDETFEDFRASIDGILALRPENITVHTLCTKRGSHNALHNAEQNAHIEQMVNYSVSALKASGFLPYYLYRQKQMAGNLENIGWCRDGFLCVNNVTVMEETLPVYACGAGAISKSVFPDGKIQRLANPKDVLLYLGQFEERMEKKRLFYKNQFTMIS